MTVLLLVTIYTSVYAGENVSYDRSHPLFFVASTAVDRQVKKEWKDKVDQAFLEVLVADSALQHAKPGDDGDDKEAAKLKFQQALAEKLRLNKQNEDHYAQERTAQLLGQYLHPQHDVVVAPRVQIKQEDLSASIQAAGWYSVGVNEAVVE